MSSLRVYAAIILPLIDSYGNRNSDSACNARGIGSDTLAGRRQGAATFAHSANLIVWPQVWERYSRVGRLARALIATGLLQKQDGVIHLIVDRLQDLTDKLPQLGHLSRDFH